MTRSESNQVVDMNNNAENQIEIQRKTFFNADIILEAYMYIGTLGLRFKYM